MRPLILISALVWAGCAAQTEPRPPPDDRFSFPTGIAHRKVAEPSKPHGALYVATSNFDKCFDTGSVLALDLDNLGLPDIGEVPAGERLEITDLKVAEDAYVYIDSFAGEMDIWAPPGSDTARLYVPTRSDNNYLHAIEVTGKTSLRCVPNQDARDCNAGALSLTRGVTGTVDDVPRAPSPLGVSVAASTELDDQGNPRPEVWVTHIEAADSPEGSAASFRSYVVRVPGDGADLSLSANNFYSLSGAGLTLGAGHATAIGARYAYVTGRSFVANETTQSAAFLLRLMDRDDPTRVLETDLRSIYFTLEARDVALSDLRVGNTERLYIVARFPDTLLVVDVVDAQSLRPRVSVVDSVPLPDGANQLAVINRGARGDLVAVTSTSTGVVAFYDTALGQIVSQVDNLGLQPYGITVDNRGDKARLYVTTFGDGRVAVIDINDLAVAQNARLVAHLGAQQGRDEEQGTSTCERQEEAP
jgi:hypothetical protein